MILEQLSVRDLIVELASEKPAPGGGSVAAVCGALGAGLSAMVSRLTLGREKYRDSWQSMEAVQMGSEHLSGQFLRLVQEDTEAYNAVVAAIRLPKDTEEQKASRAVAIQTASKRAAEIPLETLRAAEKLITWPRRRLTEAIQTRSQMQAPRCCSHGPLLQSPPIT